MMANAIYGLVGGRDLGGYCLLACGFVLIVLDSFVEKIQVVNPLWSSDVSFGDL